MSPVAKKLLIKPRNAVLVLGAPDGLALEPLPEGARIAESGSGLDAALAFARQSADLATVVPTAISAIRHDGLLWIAYLKGGTKAGTDLNRDILHAQIEREYGWTGVSLVAIDDRWSAMRFRPKELVGR